MTGVAYRDIEGERRLATRGEPVYDEPTGDGWRAWDTSRSKLGAMLDRGVDTGLEPGAKALYLGAAAGTTASHVADVARVTYAVEFAPRSARTLLDVSAGRPTIVPLLKDARAPETYAHVVESDLDIVVQDVATRGQAEVALSNRQFLVPDGRLALAIKARSEDATASPEDVFRSVLERLSDGYEILERVRLEPQHDGHLGVVATPR